MGGSREEGARENERMLGEGIWGGGEAVGGGRGAEGVVGQTQGGRWMRRESRGRMLILGAGRGGGVSQEGK